MSQLLESMAWPFLACLVLTGIHVHLGIHVLARKVIFVDLALAQVAALGSVCGVLLGWDLHTDPWQIKGFSLAFAVLAAAVFSLTRMRGERVPQEALIGITYAVALGTTILASSHLAHGAEEVSELLAGSILWVRPSTVGWTALLYVAVGAFHFAFRRQLLLVSLHPDGAEQQGLSVRLWDFLFYVSFGLVVTSSVSIAGVLLVFSFLVIPAVIAALFADGLRARLLVGWVAGTLVSGAGCALSYERDLPSGPTIVACFGAALVLAGVVHHVRASPRVAPALLRVAAGGAVLALLGAGALSLRKQEDHELEHLLESGSSSERLLALAGVEAQPERWPAVEPLAAALLREADPEVRLALLGLVEGHRATALLPEVHALLGHPDDALRDRALRTVKELHQQESVGPLAAALATEEDEYLRVELAETLAELDDARGLGALVEVVVAGTAPQARRDAWEHLAAHTRLDPGLDAALPPAEDPAAKAALRRWWQESAGRLELVAPGVFDVPSGEPEGEAEREE